MKLNQKRVTNKKDFCLDVVFFYKTEKRVL